MWLERTYWIDERSDPEKATHAAAQHMKDLYAMFGDWYLVMAAYNSGPGNVAESGGADGVCPILGAAEAPCAAEADAELCSDCCFAGLVAKDPVLYGVQVIPEKPAAVETVNIRGIRWICIWLQMRPGLSF